MVCRDLRCRYHRHLRAIWISITILECIVFVVVYWQSKSKVVVFVVLPAAAAASLSIDFPGPVSQITTNNCSFDGISRRRRSGIDENRSISKSITSERRSLTVSIQAHIHTSQPFPFFQEKFSLYKENFIKTFFHLLILFPSALNIHRLQ